MSTRRNFIKKAVTASAIPLLNGGSRFEIFKGRGNRPLYRTDNPYRDVDWQRSLHIASASHVHISGQDKLDKIYNILKLRHIPISNYYPSVPYFPPEKIRENQFMVKQDFGTIYDPDYPGKGSFSKGKFRPGPLEWNKIIMDPATGWYDKLPPDLKKNLPFREGEPVFTSIPGDIIFSPNSEQHTFTNSSLHVCALGSLFCSGTFDAHNEYLTVGHGYCPGTGQTWQEVFPKILDRLQFADGGGITLNHPVWSDLKYEDVCSMLDFDRRVLGIEVFNDLCVTGYGDPARGWGLKLWDQLLSSGRRCLGFFVPDWTVGRGKNILLVRARDSYNCLRAYRNGEFFGAIIGSGLKFTDISLQQDVLKVKTNYPVTFRIASDKGELYKEEGISWMEFKIPFTSGNLPEIGYLRIEAWDETSEQIFSQPIRFLGE